MNPHTKALPDPGSRRQLHANDLVEAIARESAPLEFASFVLGFERIEGEDRVAHEARWRALKIETGLRLEALWPERRIEFERPELRIDVTRDGTLLLRTAPLFLAGFYRKLSRRVPSNRWIHHPCRGGGCPGCGFRGTLLGPSVEETLGATVGEPSGGEEFFLHGLGREDTDARMLGRGRPFVLEVRAPRRRTLDLAVIESQTNARGAGLLEVHSLVPVSRDLVRTLKTSPAVKTYRAWIELDGAPPIDVAARAESLAGRWIEQYSPARVQHRRGRDKLRTRRIIGSTWIGRIGRHWVWEVEAQAGTYIKELVHGDGGRTRPSLAETLSVDARCDRLDVLDIEWPPRSWSFDASP